MKRIANGVELSKQSWRALRANPQLLLFLLISMAAITVASAVFFGLIVAVGVLATLASPTAGGQRPLTSQQTVEGVVVTFLYLFIAYTIVIFSNTALVGATLQLLRGEPATVVDGIRIASARLGRIVVYALISATIGTLARVGQSAAQSSDNAGAAIAAAIVGGLVQGAWSVVVFLAVPILVAEDVGMIESLKRSATLFKRTWGEGFVGRTTLGGVAFLLGLAVVGVGAMLVGLAAASGSAALVMGAIVLVVLALACVGLLSGAINGVFQASLYAYATTGNAGRFIDTALARDAFRAA